MTSALINASWEAYNNKKAQIAADPSIFCPEVLWEFNYLLDSIVAVEPGLDPITVMLAIRQAMRDTVAPRPRDFFINVVMESIRERQNQWAAILNNSQDAA